MKTYYNEFEPYAAQWLRNLCDAGEISDGFVDDRSILDVTPGELLGYDRCHFFAGIGGWEYALRLAGWPKEWPVWTGSCPCQPFSMAGKRGGGADERHLWPAWYWLIRQCRPPIIFGEQVASKDGLSWLDVVFSDLEAEGYTCGAVDLPACSIGAPHIRQRLWWGAISKSFRGRYELQVRGKWRDETTDASAINYTRPGATGILADTDSFRFQIHREKRNIRRQMSLRSDSKINNPWSTLHWLPCRDGKARPTEPGLFPLANGIPCRVGKLRAYGNVIVPQVAAEFIKIIMEYLESCRR